MPPMPDGTVTFLFTDVEGSTMLWERHTDHMREALQRHDSLLRTCIEQHGGCVFKTVGDAFCAAFPTAPEALTAALASQQALQAESWGEVGALQVRMALHTGAAQQRDGDYFGPALNRVARLLAAGHGSQVLLSLPAAELVRDSLPDGASLLDLGEHRLKDLQRPERIFQLTHPALTREFLPLRTLENRPNNLPMQSTPFIGREAQIKAVRQRLLRDDIRLLTLTGPGGTGKTRLALQVAADVLDEFPDGVYFVPLAPVTDPGLVAPSIAQALELRETPGRDPLDALKTQLHEKRLLLVLDNFEQIISAAPILSELLNTSTALNVLVTSREALRLSAEHEYPVSPLALPDPKHLPALERLTQYEAVALFIQRAMAVKPDFQVTNENAPAIAEICARLDGLPLAIELAAARVKLLSPDALLARLGSRLKVLTGGARDVPARQQTLRGAIEWSYNLLEPAEQHVFADLAVFSGGCTVEAAEAVCGADGDGEIDMLDGLASLVDKSLLRQEENGTSTAEPRFRMLETIREYGLERLAASGRADGIRERHASFYLALASEAESALRGPEQVSWLDRLEAEHDNLRAALEWLMARGDAAQALCMGGALWRFWWVRGYLREGLQRLQAIVALPGAQARTDARAEAIFGKGVLNFMLQNLDAARDAFEECRSIWEETGDQSGVAYALMNIGEVDMEQGDYAAAQTHHEESVALFRRLNDRAGLAWALASYALAIHLGGQASSEAATRAAQESVEIFTDRGEHVGLSHALAMLGTILEDQGQIEEACSRFGEALGILRTVGNRTALATLLEGIASLAVARAQPERAARLASSANAVREALGGWQFAYIKTKLMRRLVAVQQMLGESRYATACDQGKRMTPEEAIEDALAFTCAASDTQSAAVAS